MTIRQLVKFIDLRNASGLASNLQFEIDAEACGISMADLGEVRPIPSGFEWETPHGTLREKHGRMSLVVPPLTAAPGEVKS